MLPTQGGGGCPPVPSLFRLRESIAPDSFAGAFPQYCPSSSPVPAKRTKSRRGASADPERPRQADPARWAQAPPLTPAPAPRPPPPPAARPAERTSPEGCPGTRSRLPSPLQAGAGLERAGGALPARTGSATRPGGAGVGGRGLRGFSLSSPPLWQRLTQGWQAGRAARLHLALLPARQRSLAGSKGPRVALWQGKRVGTWLPE